MYKEYFLINFCLALVLLYINGFLGKIQSEYNDVGIFNYGRFSFSSYEEFNFSGNYAQKIINPTIYMALVTAAFQSFGLMRICYSLWMVVLFYWGIVFMRILLFQKLDFVNWNYELTALAVSIILCEGTYLYVIKPLLDGGETVFISLTEFRDAIWYAILAYIALTMWKIGKLHFNSSHIVGEEKIGKIISKRYKIFSDKYGTQIEERINEHDWSEGDKLSFSCLVYSIMIYEDYNRPKLCRFGERVLKRIIPWRERSLGIMQVKTMELIDDEVSIDLGIDKLCSAYLSAVEDPVGTAISDYNYGEMYHNEVSAIYEALFFLLSHQQSPDQDDADDSDGAVESESLSEAL